VLFLDGQALAAGGSDNQVHIWDLGTRTVTRELVGHTGSVAALARSGAMLVSGSYDTTVCIWDLTAPGPQPSVARAPGEEVK